MSRPATMRSEGEAARTRRDARQPTTMNAAYMATTARMAGVTGEQSSRDSRLWDLGFGLRGFGLQAQGFGPRVSLLRGESISQRGHSGAGCLTINYGGLYIRMRTRVLGHIKPIVAGAAMLAVATISLTAQSARSSGARTPDGRPRFHGRVQRRHDHAGRASRRPGQPARDDRRRSQRRSNNTNGQRNAERPRAEQRRSRPRRRSAATRSPTKSYLEGLFRAGGGVVGGYNNFWINAGRSRSSTVDGQKRSSLIVDPPDGRVPPMKPEARKRNAASRTRR